MDASFHYRLKQAICESYSREELQQMTYFCLRLPLERVSRDGTLDEIVFQLVDWAAKHPRMADLPVHAARFKLDRRAVVPTLEALRIEFETGLPAQDGGDNAKDDTDTERAVFKVVEARRRDTLLALLKGVGLAEFPFDRPLASEFADLYDDQVSRRELVITARHWLAESGSPEMALPPGYVNADAAALIWAKQLLVESGKVGTPAVAALCAVVMFDWPAATNARRVFARLCDVNGSTSA